MNQQRAAAAVSAGVVALATPLILYYEGTKQVGYLDPIGIVTACTGHTGADAVLGRTYSHQECAALLKRDIASHDAGVVACVTRPMADNVHAAALSFAFNIGVAKFCASSMAKKLNSGDIAGACAELSRWVYAAGKQLPGLVKRRAAERALCEGTA